MSHVFVFGSNLAGRHGKGAALIARNDYNAQLGFAHGRTGQSYAIPTKDRNLRTLPLDQIKRYVAIFIGYANMYPHVQFKVTAIGTGLAGYAHKDIAPMFKGVPSNCIMPKEWDPWLSPKN